MSVLEAKVKSVLSGDTIILHNIQNTKQERTLSLAFVTAPRLKREGDEVRLYIQFHTASLASLLACSHPGQTAFNWGLPLRHHLSTA